MTPLGWILLALAAAALAAGGFLLGGQRGQRKIEDAQADHSHVLGLLSAEYGRALNEARAEKAGRVGVERHALNDIEVHGVAWVEIHSLAKTIERTEGYKKITVTFGSELESGPDGKLVIYGKLNMDVRLPAPDPAAEGARP